MSTSSPVRVERCPKRIRAYLGGELVLDTVDAVYVWEDRPYPAYYVPLADVCDGVLAPSPTKTSTAHLGEAQHFTLQVGVATRADAARRYAESPAPELGAFVRFDWAALDAWFEEDEEVYVHPRSPYTRIDILDSSRRVRVSVDGVVLAESTRPRILFETGLPPRYYLSRVDVRMELLERSNTVTQCPYKGTTEHWSARIGDHVVDDVAWSYRTPLPESQKIAGLIAFYDRRVLLEVSP